MRKNIVVLALMCVVPSTIMADNKIPEEILTVLENAEEIELYSLDPTDDEANPKELGKTVIKNAEDRKKLVAEFKKGVEEGDAAAKCFDPRHRIKAKHKDKTVDLVICFQCMQICCYVDGKKTKTLITTNKPQAYFDGVLKDAGVRLAPKPKE